MADEKKPVKNVNIKFEYSGPRINVVAAAAFSCSGAVGRVGKLADGHGEGVGELGHPPAVAARRGNFDRRAGGPFADRSPRSGNAA